MYLRTLLVALIIAIAPTASGEIVADSYEIDVSYDPASATLDGEAHVTFAGEPTGGVIEFYLSDTLHVSGVSAGGAPAPFSQEIAPYTFNYTTRANRVRVVANDLTDGLTISYGGQMPASSERSPSDYMRVDADGVFLRAYAYSLWFPIFAEPEEDPPAVDLRSIAVTAPVRFRSVVVGDRISRTVRAGHAREVWRAEDVSLFDAQLTIRPFVVIGQEPVFVYALESAESRAAAERIAAASGVLLAYYRSHYRESAGAHPTYVVELPEFGDIASGNVIGVQESGWNELSADSAEIVTLAHELVHAYVQGRTPREDRLYALSMEGFPSYFHWLALAALRNDPTVYESRMDRVQVRYLERRQTGLDYRGEPLPPEKPLLQMTADDIGLFKDRFVLNDRALLFWDHLRRTIGASRFDELVRDMCQRDRLTADDFLALLQSRAPEFMADAHLWLETTEFPDRLRRPA